MKENIIEQSSVKLTPLEVVHYQLSSNGSIVMDSLRKKVPGLVPSHSEVLNMKKTMPKPFL